MQPNSLPSAGSSEFVSNAEIQADRSPSLPALEELPDFRILEIVWERREYILLRARARAGGEIRLVQVFTNLLPGSNTYARLKHGSQRVFEAVGRGILRILEIRAASDRVCLIREDFRGLPLDLFLGAQNLDLRERLSLAVGLVSILEKIHRGEMAHLSLSPDNVLVDPADHRIKLWNCLGETRESNPNALGAEADRILAYRAPEQFGRLNRAVDQRADLYACGILIYQILTRRLPFHAPGPEDWMYCHLARTPLTPETWDPAIPPVLSQIVLKLLAKDPDDRYQTAHGLLLDLEDCREQWDESGKIQVLSQSGNARRGEFFLPQRLYGREQEIEMLKDAWENLVPGNAAVVLVSGAAGMGKTCLIHEWSSSLPSGTLLARGKFEQVNRASPFSAWRGAFADLLDQLLTGSAASIDMLRNRAGEFLGPSAVLAGELLPELATLLEPGASVDSGSDQAVSRLLAGLERFLAAIPENRGGLAVFLDDMQWADEASLNLFRELAASRAFPRLCLIGACRITGSDAKGTLDALWEGMGRPGTGRFHPIRLPPISKQTIQTFIADALGADAASLSSLSSLAALVHMKSHGNPFHMREILTYLHRERILRYAPAGGWRWDLGRLAKVEDGFTLNNLVAERWVRMTSWEREILQLSACAGTGPLLDDLIKVTGRKREELLEALQGPLRLGFLQPSAGDYRFAHDRLWESVYFQLPETQRARLHARIARGLLRSGDQDAFKIVRHLQAANPADLPPGDRPAISRIYLEAAARSKISASPAAALDLYEAGRKSAGPEAWQTDRALAMELALGCMEAACLRGAMDKGDASFAEIRAHCSDPLELTRAYAARMTSLGEANALESAVACLREGLSLLGAGLPVEPDEIEAAIRIELAKAARLKEGRSLRDFAEAPQITDAGFLAVTDLLSRSAMILFYSDQNLLTLVQLKMVNLILEYGNTVQSPFAYLAYGWILAAEGEDFASAYAFGRLAVESVSGGAGAFQGCMLEEIHASMIKHWIRPFRECADMLRHAFHAGRESGDLQYALLGQLNRLGMLLIAGESLQRLDEEFRSHAALFERMGSSYPAFLFGLRWSQVRSLRGPRGGRLPEPPAGNTPEVSALESGNRLARFNHHHVGEILAYFAGDMETAREHSLAAESCRGRANALPAVAEHAFYSALILASLPDGIAGAGEREFELYSARLARWAEACPENYRARHLLASAELRLAHGLHREAESLYRAAAREAESQGQIQIVAIAFERAGLHYQERGHHLAAEACLSRALRAYDSWGAGAKVDRMLAAHPLLRAEAREGTSPPTPALAEGGDGRDGILDQVLKACRSLSAEVSPEPLLKRLMANIMEISGAQKGCLLIQEEDVLILAAESEESGRTCMLRRSEGEAPDALAWSAARFANRNGKPLVLEDAHREGIFREDSHVRASAVRSLLCIPVCAEGGRRGILYLENNALPGAFTPGRTELLELIAAQAAISLRNSDLYEQARNLASHLQTVRESERRKVAREVHDELGHALTALHLDLSWLALKGPRESPDFLEKVGSMARLVETTVQSVQRIISDLRPAVLDQLGLCEALEWQVKELGKRTGLECHLDLPESNPDLPAEAAAALFRILQEGISNVLRHAEAKRIWVRLDSGAGGAAGVGGASGAGKELRLEIRDDGKGITPAQVGHPLSFGLAGMRERLRPWDGDLRVAACEGGGTLVAAVLPMRSGSNHA